MNSIHSGFDPDDNFPDDHEPDSGPDDELSVEGLIWQLLQLINPGDEEAALQQFSAWQEEAGSDSTGGEHRADPIEQLRQVIDWKSGFHVDAADPGGLIQCVEELAARWNLSIDWGVEDPNDEEFLRDADVASLIGRAHDRLREHGYSLWTWGVHGAPREDLFAGWITLRSDNEALEIIAPALGLDLRSGGAF